MKEVAEATRERGRQAHAGWEPASDGLGREARATLARDWPGRETEPGPGVFEGYKQTGSIEMQDVTAQSAAAITRCEAAAINPPTVYEPDDRTADDQLRELKSKLEAMEEAFNENGSLHAERFLSPVIDVTAYMQKRGVAPVIETPRGEFVITLEGGADDFSWGRLAYALDGLAIFAKAMDALDRTRAGKVGA